LNKTILVVDDERAIREMICMALQHDGYDCVEAANAMDAERQALQDPPALLLIDWMMPGISGTELVRKLRRNEKTKRIPIIMLTAKTEEDNRIYGLDSGADDYITKPFSTKELLARIRAHLRRIDVLQGAATLSMGGLTLDLADSTEVNIGPTEFKLVKYFLENPDRVLSREQVLNHVWGESVYIEDRTVDVHIRRLRKALEPTGHDKLLQTVRGFGYRLSRTI